MEEAKGDFTLNSDWVVNQERLHKELICPIWMGVLRNPKECSEWETAFCGSCLYRSLESNNRCPLKCSTNIKVKDKCHKIIRNALSDLVLKCWYEECDKQFSYDAFFKHKSDWEFGMTKCKDCGKQVERRKMHQHHMICEEGRIFWEYCEFGVKRKLYEHHINNYWQEYSIRWVKCNRTFKRKDEALHDCIRHLTNCVKNLNDEVKHLKKELIDSQEVNRLILNELAVIKTTICKKLNIDPVEVNYNTVGETL